jgi:catechol-2,3-dioxygenase
MSVKVTKLGFLGLSVVKFDEMKHHYANVLGLANSSDTGSGEAYFACGNEHHAVAFFRAYQSGHRHIGLQLSPDQSLEDASRSLTAAGIRNDIQSNPFYGIDRAIKFQDPDGYAFYLYSSMSQSKTPFSGNGIAPRKLGHVAMHAADAKASTAFFTGHLGFRWSDWMADFFVFLRCNTDHHTLNFMTSPRRGMFHVAFEVADFAQIGRACDILGTHNIPLIWGPGRHGIGHNIFTYHHDPDGNIVEVFADMDRISDERLGYFDPRPYHQDFPQRPKVWPRDLIAANMWGLPPPPGFEA